MSLNDKEELIQLIKNYEEIREIQRKAQEEKDNEHKEYIIKLVKDTKESSDDLERIENNIKCLNLLIREVSFRQYAKDRDISCWEYLKGIPILNEFEAIPPFSMLEAGILCLEGMRDKLIAERKDDRS